MKHRRGRRYCNDLRFRVPAAVGSGGRVYASAKIFDAGVSCIRKAVDRQHKTGLSTVSEVRGHAPCRLTRGQEGHSRRLGALDEAV